MSRPRLDTIGKALAHAFFALLIVVDVIRTLHHAMWRDEVAYILIAMCSPSSLDLVTQAEVRAPSRAMVYN